VASYSESVGRRLSQGASNSPPDFNTRKQLIRRSSGNPSPADSSRMSIFSASELIGAKLSNNNLYVENDLPRSPNLLSPGVFFRWVASGKNPHALFYAISTATVVTRSISRPYGTLESRAKRDQHHIIELKIKL